MFSPQNGAKFSEVSQLAATAQKKIPQNETFRALLVQVNDDTSESVQVASFSTLHGGGAWSM